MRAVLVTFLLVGLLASPSLGVINIKLTASGPTWNGGPAVMPTQNMTVHIWAQGTNSGIWSLAGDIVASGPGLASADAGSLVFSSPEFDPPFLLYPVRGVPGPNGGWLGFGAQRADWMNPIPDLGWLDYIEVCRYTLRVGEPWTWGPVTLTFVPRSIGGYKPLETDKTGILGTITPLTLTVIPEPVTLALLALGGLMLARRRT